MSGRICPSDRIPRAGKQCPRIRHREFTLDLEGRCRLHPLFSRVIDRLDLHQNILGDNVGDRRPVKRTIRDRDRNAVDRGGIRAAIIFVTDIDITEVTLARPGNIVGGASGLPIGRGIRRIVHRVHDDLADHFEGIGVSVNEGREARISYPNEGGIGQCGRKRDSGHVRR